VYNRRGRKEVYDWIRELAVRILEEAGATGKEAADTAWRVAVETWLRRTG